jgi:hypothetical protein
VAARLNEMSRNKKRGNIKECSLCQGDLAFFLLFRRVFLTGFFFLALGGIIFLETGS